jgi:hypothetical protein
MLEQVMQYNSSLLTSLGQPIGQANEDVLRAISYWPFDNEIQWEFADWIVSTGLSGEEITTGAVPKYAKWIIPECGFKSLYDFKKRIDLLPAKGSEWASKNLKPKQDSPSWVPQHIEFWIRDSLEILKGMIGDVRLAEEMKWAPEKIYNSKNERIYSELWSGDWWSDMQVIGSLKY